MKRLIFLFTTLTILTGCKDIFTTSVLESLAESPEDMTADELSSYLDETPLQDISEEQLKGIEDVLLEDYEVLTDDELEDLTPEQLEEYVEENVQLLEINMEQADVEGLIIDIISLSSDEEGSEESDPEEILTELFEDEERIEDLAEAGDFAIEAYKADEDSLTGEQLVIGSLGLVSEFIVESGEEDAPTVLTELDDLETATLTDAGYSEDQIEDIQLAAEMMEAAGDKLPADMASALEGFPI